MLRAVTVYKIAYVRFFDLMLFAQVATPKYFALSLRLYLSWCI